MVITTDAQIHADAFVPADGLEVATRVCVVDLGTNSFHAVMVDAFPNGAFTVLDKIKEMVRLGDEGLGDHRLSKEAMDRGIRALRRIRLLADGWRVTEFRAFATSAIREARNGGAFIRRAWEEAGIHVRAISGELEARLIYQGVRRAVDLTDPTLLVDIGGGSTEFIVGDRTESILETSLKLGAARMTERFVTTDPVCKDEFRALREYYRKQLAPVFEVARAQGVKEIVGSSGTMENIAQVYVNLLGNPDLSIVHQSFDAKDMRRVTKAIMTSTEAEREAMVGIDAKRVPQVVAGATLVDVLLKDLPVERLRISPYALREGIVIHFLESNNERLEAIAPYRDVRRRSVYELGFRCSWDRQHAQHVAALSLHLFDATRTLHELDYAARELLECAALLHDIGYLISRSSHHKHGAYLISNADLLGFHPDEIAIMAQVVRYHRGSQPKEKHSSFNDMPKRQRRLVEKLAPFVRLAEGLDRSHFQNVTRLQTRLTEETLLLTLYTQSDPQLDVWGASTRSDFFKRVYDRDLEVRAHREVHGEVS